MMDSECQEGGLMENAVALIDTANTSNGNVVNIVVKEPRSSSSSDSNDSSFELMEALPPWQHAITLMDINDASLKQIGDLGEVVNLSKGTFANPTFPVIGHIFEPNNRLMACLVCRCARSPFAVPSQVTINVWFVIESGSNCTFLSEETIKKLVCSDAAPDALYVSIQDPASVIECHKSHSHFKDANILGMMAMRKLGVGISHMNWFAKTWMLTREESSE